MKRFLSTLLILISLLLITSCTNPSADATSLKESQNTKSETITVYVTNTGKKYHEYGCRYLQFSCIEKELQQAINQGYTPCYICITP